ncbi:MAG: hypothetical protein Q9M30_05770 [Mariprofundaceae bacterium]|nr:hypothetical protein [Mariprofundaceae bacterium]
MGSSRISGRDFEEKRSVSKRSIILALVLIIAALGLVIGAAHAGKRIELNSSASFPVDI